jgi:hypothetical protein
MFNYDHRGFLSATHLRFFTRCSFLMMVERRVLEVRRIETMGLPRHALELQGAKIRAIRALDRVMTDGWPTRFGYPFIVEVTAARI